MLKLGAPAKLNLVLEVLGRRSDGYHDIRRIMQTISLFDYLSFRRAHKLELKCNVPQLQTADNLVLKAAAALKSMTGYGGGAVITLDKHIPWGAGLGGGSSDSAATLLGLSKLWGLKLSYTDLIRAGVVVGSDVPFFIRGGTCLVEGRGDKIYALPDLKQAWFVLLKPEILPVPAKTAKLYDMMQISHYTTGIFTEKARNFLEKEGRLSPRLLHNVFDDVAEEAFQGLADCKKLMLRAGAERVHLAGSGPVLFTQFDDESTARSVAGKLAGHNAWARMVTSVTRGEIEFQPG